MPEANELQSLSPTLLETARAYLAAGLSVIPVRADGSKAPVEPKWDRYAEKRATDKDLVRWFGEAHRGIGICGGKDKAKEKFESMPAPQPS